MNRMLVIGALMLLSGCSGRADDSVPPFSLAGPKTLRLGESPRDPSGVSKPKLTLTDGMRPIHVGDKVTCEVTVIAISKQLMPTGVLLELLQGERIFDSIHATPNRVEGADTYVLRGELTAPTKPGRYQIRATAIDVDIRPPAGDVEAEITPIIAKSKAIEIQVKP